MEQIIELLENIYLFTRIETILVIAIAISTIISAVNSFYK